MKPRGSVRRYVRINRPAAEVWPWIGEPGRVHEWFPGIVDCSVDGSTRVVVTGSGIPMPQELLTIDPLQRRFQYRIHGPMFKEHLSTIDVLDMGDGTTVVQYAVDVNPSTMALVLGGAAGNAIQNLRALLEADT